MKEIPLPTIWVGGAGEGAFRISEFDSLGSETEEKSNRRRKKAMEPVACQTAGRQEVETSATARSIYS